VHLYLTLNYRYFSEINNNHCRHSQAKMCEESHPNPTNLARQRTRLYMTLRARDQLTPCLEKFGALERNFERVDYVIKLTKDLNLHAVFQDDNKNDETAVKLREKGNDMFKVKKVKEAWELYTRSISYAEENSANLGIAYANRSAVLFEVNLHKECLMVSQLIAWIYLKFCSSGYRQSLGK
jgi:hypothetical protein